MKLPNVEPGGWAFEYCNNALSRHRRHGRGPYRPRAFPQRCEIQGDWASTRPSARAVDWLIAMQSRGGGWGAFDKDNDKKILTKIPFCDFGEALDPPSVDVTAHVVEAFAKLGLPRDHPVDGAGARLYQARAGAGRALVRPLGRQLSSTARRRPARARGHRRGYARALYRPRLRLAPRAPAGQRRLGRKLRLLHGRRLPPAAARPPPRRPPGR